MQFLFNENFSTQERDQPCAPSCNSTTNRDHKEIFLCRVMLNQRRDFAMEFRDAHRYMNSDDNNDDDDEGEEVFI